MTAKMNEKKEILGQRLKTRMYVVLETHKIIVVLFMTLLLIGAFIAIVQLSVYNACILLPYLIWLLIIQNVLMIVKTTLKKQVR